MLTLLSLLFSIHWNATAMATTYTITNEVERASFTGDYQYLDEIQGPIEFERIQALYTTQPEHWVRLSKIKMKFSDQGKWFAFTVKNDLNRSIDRVLEYPYGCVDKLDFFIVRDDDSVENLSAYQNKKLMDRNLELRRASINISFAAQEEILIFMRAESYHLLGIDLDIRSAEAAKDYERSYHTVAVLYVGLAIALLLYYLFINLSEKQSVNLAFNGFILTIVIMIMVIADIPVYFGIIVPSWVHRLLPILRPLAGLSGVIFLQIFLQTKMRKPKLDVYINILKGTFILLALIGITPWYPFSSTIVQHFNFLYLLSSVVISLYIYISDKYRPAIYFLFAFGSFFISGLIYFLTWNFGLFERSFFLSNIILLGSALEMLLFSFAIADQFKFRIHQEFGMRLKAEEDLKELNQQLEIKIIEKTNEAFKNEKRAVLGEMAGSIAHELNSPLTAVHSGVDRLTMLLNKPEFDKEKLNKTNNRIKGVMEKIFRITKSLQMYGTDVSRDEFHEFSAKEIMNDAIEYCKDSFDFSKFTFKLDTQLDKIYCQKRAITQAVATLLKLRLSLLETNNGDMRLEIKGDDKYSYLNFHDSAGEIPEWIVDFITNPHSKLNGENKGSGLELTLLRDIIEKHKALIQFNKTEIDLRITIKLPISN